MLENIRECEEAVFETGNGADFLDCRAVLGDAEDLVEPFVDALGVAHFVNVFVGDVLAEREVAFGDIVVVVIVKSGGADVLILLW